MAKRIRSECQDGGLWYIYYGEKYESGTMLGYVWNKGYMPEDREGEPYYPCQGWDSCVPVGILAQCPTFMSAVKVLWDQYKMNNQPSEPLVLHIKAARESKGQNEQIHQGTETGLPNLWVFHAAQAGFEGCERLLRVSGLPVDFPSGD